MLEQLVMAGSAVPIHTFHVRGMVERYIPILGYKGKLVGRSFLVLSKNPKRSAQGYGQKTREESTHATKGSIFSAVGSLRRCN